MRLESPPRVLITGAGSGIGLACAEYLAQGGAELILCDNDSKALSSASETLGAVGRFCDVSSEASVAVLAADILQRYDSLDMIVNAAGGGYERTLGMYRVSRALVPILKRGTVGNVVLNIPPSNDEAGLAIFPYASSKQAFQRLSAALASETRGSAIRVLIGCPRNGQVSEVLPDRNARGWDRAWEFEHGGNDDWGKLSRQIASLVGLPGDSDQSRQAG